MKTYGVIMAGGGGTRFWPLSRKKLPKQFLNLTGRDILVNETFDRLKGVAYSDDIFVVTNTLYVEKTQELMGDRIKKSHILGEPAARNTAACIGYAAMEIMKKYGDGVMCVMPSDHYIRHEEIYIETIKHAVTLADEKNCLVTIGIKPDYPATGYGYIRSRQALDTTGNPSDYRLVDEFVEKPEEDEAIEYLREGCYSWNSGMFVWKASVILKYFKRLLPDIYECLDLIGQAMNTPQEEEVLIEIYPQIPKISIDYGIMERADNVIMLEGTFGWNDIGSLDACDVLCEPDEKGNVGIGKYVMMDTEGTICYAKDKLICAAYVKDLMVVESDDVILVCPKQKAQNVKNIVEMLNEKGLNEYL
ncbi:MAG TPA: mannose-1-phosphate guanylyltransferase [Lachnospiraceae bacterium]|nr:mannose-1-phosphate guanylyltransferase [Lachnospiraceae bacterium]